MQTDVSVIILSYNPKISKMLSTIKSVVCQKNISFETIISDDGSADDCFKEIKNIFKKYNYKNYKLIKNRENAGTVKNCINALNKADGKYVFLTSPGDLIFDENTLKSFYDFAESKNAKICFGNAVYYNHEDGILKIYINGEYPNHPINPYVYTEKYSEFYTKTSFFLQDAILGASYFRETEFFRKYINRISGLSKYVEDTTSTYWALIDNVPIYYYEKNIVWYEYGTGISTGKNDKWQKIVENDCCTVLKKLIKLYPNNKILKATLEIKENCGKRNIKKLIIFVLKYPMLFFIKKFKIKKIPVRKVQCSDNDVKRLEEMMDNNE